MKKIYGLIFVLISINFALFGSAQEGNNEMFKIHESWIFSTYTNNFDPIDLGGSALVRGMDTWNGKIYFPFRGGIGKHKIHVYDGEIGDYIRSINLQKDIFTKIENGDTAFAVTLPNNDLHFDNVGNCLIGGCVITDNTEKQPMLIYNVNLETGECKEIINEEITASNARFDAFDVYGDINNSAIIMAIDNNSLCCYRWIISNGISKNAEKILVPQMEGPWDNTNSITSGRIYIDNDSIFYIDGWGSYANRYKYKDGKIIYLDNAENTPDVNLDNSNLAGCTEFQLKDKNGEEQYFFISAKVNPDDGGYTYYFDLIQFADENKDFAKATYLCSFPENTSKMNSNSYRTAEVSVEVIDNIAEIYIYIGENGYAKYRFSIDGQEVINEVKNITIAIPEEVKEYNTYIELVNKETNGYQKYVVSDRDTYTFFGLTTNIVYDVYLKTQQGSVIGTIKDIELKDEDVNVTFETLSTPQVINITVLTPEKEDVTSQVQVSWFDNKNTFIKKSSSVSGFIAGDSLYYNISLPYNLGIKYKSFDLTNYIVKKSDNNIILSLLPLELCTINGVVKDSIGGYISNAVISINQKINDKYTKIETFKADNKGNFSIDVIKDYTEITISANDYVVVKDTITEIVNDTIDLGTINLQQISGATIDLNFTYTESVATNEDAKVMSFYSDYDNVGYEIFNKTQNKVISKYSVQYPRIILLEEVNENDILELTISCRKNSFQPFKVECFIKNEKATAEINILQLGGIKASYTKTDNKKVVGILYNDKGQFIKKQEYKNDTLNLTNIIDGDYILVSMGVSSLFNDVYNIETFQNLGLTVGTDYVENKIKVSSGNINCINNKSIPTFDESKLYYTDANSNFSVNKNSIVVGNYLTLKCNVNFKSEYKQLIEDVNLIVDIPENSVFTENSVMKGYTIAPYTISNNQINIPISDGDNVRFCITPTLKGDYKITAYVEFQINGEKVLQPIGSVNFVGEDLNINVPSIISKDEFVVSGKAFANTRIEIYDDNLLLGETMSLGNGVWSTTCTLNNPYNLSTHKIYAKIFTDKGLELQTEVKECQYDINAIEVKTVTMINFSHRNNSKHEERTVFDFLNEQKSIPAYWYWPTYPEFTFLIDFTQNDTSKISNVILYVETGNGEHVPLNATYNEKHNCWIATKKFGEEDNYNIPVNVSVDFDVKKQILLDAELLSEVSSLFNSILFDYNQQKQKYDLLMKDTTNVDSLLYSNNFLTKEDFYTTDSLYDYFTSLSDEELDLLVEKNKEFNFTVIKDSLEWIFKVNENSLTTIDTFNYEFNNGLSYSLKTCEGLVDTILINDGFIEYKTTDGNIYIRNLNDLTEYINMQQNVYISIKNNTSLSKSYIKSYSLEEGLDVFNEWMDKINATYQPIADAYKDLEEKIGNLVKTLEKDLIKYSQEVNKRNFSYQMKRVKMERLEKELNNLNSLTQEYQLKKIEITNFRKELNNSRHLYLLATKNQFLTKNLLVLSRPMGGILEKQCPLAKYGGLVYDGLSIVRKFQKIYLSIPNPCEKDLNKANDCRTMSIAAGVYAGGLLTTKIGVEAMMDIATATQVVASGVTGGVSLGTAFATVVGKMVAGIALDVAFNWEIDKREAQIRSVIAQLKCSDNNNDGNDNNDDDDDDKKKKGGKHKPKGPGVEGVHDPSGYVYEGVPSNRLEGVMASCYYKEEVEDMYGDKQENVVLWNAENYAQENPLFTDENGMYRWDVPQGLWQVKFEKDGYQTTYSEWLPVPPPQLEVNVEMVQNIQPKVDNVKVYEQGIDIEFSKYMSIESINVDNIIVSQNGENFAGTITLLDEEQTYLDNTKTYVSKVRFNPLIEFSANEKVTLKVSRKVKSYTGMQMEADYIQTFDIAKEVKSIKADSIVILSYDSSKEIEVEILPAEAAVGKFLIVESISPTIASIARDTIKIGENGKINVTITGELPGNAAINFTIDSTDISATTLVKVVNKVEEPYVSIESGTAVYYGTKISLNCNTEDAVIYYTLDGSCPCDDNAIKYSEPITIDKNMIIKALAVSIDGIESEIVEFQYTLKPYTVILSAENGSVFGGGEYNHGEEITISAIPNDGYEFVKWSDDNIENPRKLIVTQDIILKAIFVRLDATLIENINEESSNIVYYGNGIICVVNKGKSYEIFDASGKLIYTGRESVLSLPRGVYVVVIEGEVEKVVL